MGCSVYVAGVSPGGWSPQYKPARAVAGDVFPAFLALLAVVFWSYFPELTGDAKEM